jgi:phosphoribosylaminoimidazole-succinocarboxamide synthase
MDKGLSGLNLIMQGKVRELYDFDDKILLVTSDRISAFDVIMPDLVEGKGEVLTQISLFWFKQFESIVPNHIITADVDEYPEECKPHREYLKGRSMLVKKTKPLPIECVVRGFITGSGWKSYLNDGTVCGIKLPEGLKESEELPQPLFTPSTKAELGEHDENISFEEVVKLIGEEKANRVKDISIEIYKKGVEIASKLGIIIADTKFEFGILDDEIILIDEVLTPDSSRFWPKETYKPGGAQKSFDKQFLRDYLKTLDWDKQAPGPKLPDEIIAKTSEKYNEAMKLFLGK